MEKMNVLDGNKLIAEFLEWKKYESFNYITPYFQDYLSVGNGLEQTCIFRNEELKFHTSWDWLMPVVKKIEKIGETKKSYGKLVDITTTYVKINKGVTKGDIIIDLKLSDNSKLTKLEAVYKAVVEFIKWYNESK